MDRLRVNLTDFNAVHFGPSSLLAPQELSGRSESTPRKAKDEKLTEENDIPPKCTNAQLRHSAESRHIPRSFTSHDEDESDTHK